MADISIRRTQDGATQLVINGVDVSMDVFHGVELVEVGDDPTCAEVGLRVTFAVSKLDLETDADVKITDNFRSVAQRVRTVQEPTSSVA